MQKQYQKIGTFRNRFKSFYKLFPDVEFEIFQCYTDDRNEYAYIHIKDYSDGTQFRKAYKWVCSKISKNNYSNILNSCRKKLIFLPKNRNIIIKIDRDGNVRSLDRKNKTS